MEEPPADPLRHHGDADATPGMLDFAVNVHGSVPPAWLRERLAAELDGLAGYPSAAQDRATREAVAARHGRSPDEVLPLAGAAEAFALLPWLRPRQAAVVHPSFTEPEVALRTHGIPVRRVLLPEPYALRPELVPDEADLVVLGNPTNPTSVLHGDVAALVRPGRVLVVDEAFADTVPGERCSLAGHRVPGVLVLRSLTKTYALAGLRAGYLLGDPELLAALARPRPPWPVGSLVSAAIRACSEPRGVDHARRLAGELPARRRWLADRLGALGASVTGPAAAPFLLARVPDGQRVRASLRERGIAVRRCDTFPGLGPDHLRISVRAEADCERLLAALAQTL